MSYNSVLSPGHENNIRTYCYEFALVFGAQLQIAAVDRMCGEDPQKSKCNDIMGVITDIQEKLCKAEQTHSLCTLGCSLPRALFPN